MFFAICLYGYLGMLMMQMRTFGSHDTDFLFQDPLHGAATTQFNETMADNLYNMQEQIWPFVDLVNSISRTYTYYYLAQSVVVTVMVMRLQQYLSFQKKLSAVRDTFSSIMDEMLNIGIVLLLVCFFVGALNCLAFGLYDPAFQSFPQAFMEMLLLCFALYKPAASTPFVPSMFKYVPHTMSDVEYMKWVPLVLAVLFKTLVVLLLFKLLMGVIMEGYKKSNKARQSSHQVRDDLKELGRNVYHYVWGHLIRRKPYVSFFHVALAVATHEVDEDKPWEQYFLGLDHPHKIEKALNAVLDANQFPHMAAQIKQCMNLKLHWRLVDGHLCF